MNITFLTEMEGTSKVPINFPNMRTEFAWMHALDAMHRYLGDFHEVKEQDHVFLILPKGELNLNTVGATLNNKTNPWTEFLGSNFIEVLKSNNKKVHYIQEGPTWLFNDYEMIDQFNFYNNLAICDSIFAHNEYDTKFYKGLFPNKQINIMPTLLIEELLKDIKPNPEEKVIIGGNFARWYGGFQSYSVADEFEVEKWTQESHAKRENEDQIPDLNHLKRSWWIEWMKTLSTFKYAVHLMPTIAAGTFSLNCAYFGIPCIGNEKVDTQRLCHPDLSVDVDDVERARKLAKQLKEDKEWYKHCSKISKWNYHQHYKIEKWREKVNLK
tara:strand:- start:1568 stop:2545 length:978 start_codon:yes stop_codon:yes gene_type:complete